MSSILEMTTATEDMLKTNLLKNFLTENQSENEWCFEGDFFDRMEEGFHIRKSLGDPRVEPYEYEELIDGVAHFFNNRFSEKNPQVCWANDARVLYKSLLYSHEFFHEFFIPKIVHPLSNRVILYMINPKIAKSRRVGDTNFLAKKSTNKSLNDALSRTLGAKLRSL